MTLTERIQTALIGSDYMGVNETEQLLSDIVGHEMTWYDTCIDDGADDDEGAEQYREGAAEVLRLHPGDRVIN